MARGKFYKTIHYIRAEKIRVIDKDGKQIGVIPTTEALAKAKEQGLDLVEVVSQAQPPICKIIDFKRFLYQQKKKRQTDRQGQKQPELKQIRLGLFIDEHDLQRRLNRASGFLKNGNKVKFIISFRGRQITKKEMGFDLFKKIKEELEKIANVVQPPRFKGRILEMTLEFKNDKN